MVLQCRQSEQQQNIPYGETSCCSTQACRQRYAYLLAHSTLVGVTWGLVVMRVWDEPRHNPQHRERLDLQVCGVRPTLGLIQGHQGIALLIHIQVLHQTVVQEVVEAPLTVLQLGNVVGCDTGHAVVTDDEGAAHPAPPTLLFTHPNFTRHHRVVLLQHHKFLRTD